MTTNENSSNSAGTTPFPTSSGTAGTAGSAAAPTPSSSQQPSDLLNRLVASAHQAIDRFAGQAAPRLDRLNEGVHSASTRLREQADHGRAYSEELGESLRCTVRERPLAAIGTAFAIGYLIARLTR